MHERGWMNATGPSAPLRGCFVDQLDTLRSEPIELRPDVIDLQADVVEAFAARLEEARHTGRCVGRLDQLDVRLAHGQKGDAHAVAGNGQKHVERQAQLVAIDRQCRIHVAHDDGDVMHPRGLLDQREPLFY